MSMYNPPRKVKRIRELALRDDPVDLSEATANLDSRAPVPRAPTPPASSPTPRRRGRKPAGPLSKSAREQLRKTNHSVIEKRRREKINEALAALRELVPNDKLDGEKKEDKEFKLEILVRTVEYLRMMVAKVKNFEDGVCQKCRATTATVAAPKSPPRDKEPPTSLKRKRPESDDGSATDDLDDESDAVFLTPAPPEQPAPPPPRPKSPLPHLPSISSWMPDPPAQSTKPPPQLANSYAFQLPSPPQTAPFAPTAASSGCLPRLMLPSPGFPSPVQKHQAQEKASPPADRARSFHSGSPFNGTRDHDVPELPLDTNGHDARRPRLVRPPLLLSPPKLTAPRDRASQAEAATSNPGSGQSKARMASRGGAPSPVSPWSRDDQTAASLLLNISSLDRPPPPLSSASGPLPALDRGRNPGQGQRRGFGAQTPSSVLGMADGV